MDKKSFLKGILTGIVATVLVVTLGTIGNIAYRFYNRKEMSVENKANTIVQMLEKYYIDDLDYDAVAEGVYQGIASSQGDPYTTYMNAEVVEQFLESNNGTFFGIGVEVSLDPESGDLVVMTTLPDTPAEAAGIQEGDRLIAADGIDLVGMDLDLAVSKIRGKKGTTVDLKIYREKTAETLDFTIERSQINVTSVKYEMLEDNIGYIRIIQFKKNTTDQFKEALNVLQAGGMRGLVLDIRSNPGGLFDTVSEIGNMLLPQGLMVYTVDYSGNRADTVCPGPGLDIPYVVLVNGNSASASEILAGAVKDEGVAPIVGTQTFGKGVVQQMYYLADGSAMKITMQRYYTPNGTSIHGTGITPDYVVELPGDGTDTQLEKGLELLQEKLGE